MVGESKIKLIEEIYNKSSVLGTDFLWLEKTRPSFLKKSNKSFALGADFYGNVIGLTQG